MPATASPNPTWAAAALSACALAAFAAPPPPAPCNLVVSTTADLGAGSLREAIARANAAPGPCTIRFDSTGGPFAEPRTIALASELPPLEREVTIDGTIEDRLWTATGVTLSGAARRRVLRVAPGARAAVRSLTIADGAARDGGGILNEGVLIVSGVTFTGNTAERDGGAVASSRGGITVVNSTFAGNRAGARGGALAHVGGSATVTNCTFSGNRARKGGGVYSRRPLVLRNTILADNVGADCVARSAPAPGSTHNLIVTNKGCGSPLVSADPRLGAFGLYNGPTRTFPLQGDSPAINMGDNSAAVDEDGRPLAWDQRGNGDPRVVAGFADIGAFEVQAFPVLVVNTTEDNGLRACTGVAAPTCSLRGAIELANAAGEPRVIGFDPHVFANGAAITLAAPLPEGVVDLTLDATGTAGVVVRGPAPGPSAAAGHAITLKRVTFLTAR